MKKFIAAFLAFIMTLSLLTVVTSVSVFAEEDPVSKVLSKLPDNAFKGDYKESRAKDGSVTRVFNNGCVLTRHADGTSTSVDQNGNQYRMEQDGSYTIRTTDGYKYTSYKDGRESLTEPKGMTTTYNTDGSYSETIPNGMITDFDAYGNVIGAGVVGSNERIGVDENGVVKNGEIKGPNGVELIITDESVHVVNENGDVFDYNNADGTETVNIKYTDGTTVDQKITETDHNEIGTCVIVEPDGTRWEGNVFSGVDQNGVPQNVDTMRWIGADGRSIWVDNNSKAIVYKDDNGNIKQFIADENGNLTDFSGAGYGWNVTYDENGNIKDANITFPDETKLAQNLDGSIMIAPPDGTTYRSDGNGNVTKNGEPIKQDGEWLPDTSADEPSDKPTDEQKSGLSAERVAGTYPITGSETWIDFDDDEFSDTEDVSVTVIFTAAGERALNMSVRDYGASYGSIDYDPTTGKCSFVDEDGLVICITFSEKDGGITVSLNYDQTFSDGRAYGSYSGSKQ